MKFTRIFLVLLALNFVLFSCSDKDDDNITPNQNPTPNPDNGSGQEETKSYYFLGIESGTGSEPIDVLSPANSVTEGSVSPVNNGFEQGAWTTFFQGIDQIFTSSYTSAPEFTSYELSNGQLVKGESFFTDLSVYAVDVIDEANMILMGSAREGLAEKKIYQVNTNSMSIQNTVTVDFGNVEEDSLLAFPVDLKVRGDKLFAAYYLVHASGNFTTPKAENAHVAVFSYPDLTFEKIITDERAPNIGRYFTTNALEITESGDIYTFSPSSLACGYAPAPAKNSGILRIKNGETEFDPSFHIDFEELSGGYKINDMFYIADGKAVARVLKEDETNPDFIWASYSPNSSFPLLETGILDLNTQTFTLLSNVPKSGGGWNSAHLVEGKKIHLGISNNSYSGIYTIDVESGTATEGAKVEGNYPKAILKLTE